MPIFLVSCVVVAIVLMIYAAHRKKTGTAELEISYRPIYDILERINMLRGNVFVLFGKTATVVVNEGIAPEDYRDFARAFNVLYDETEALVQEMNKLKQFDMAKYGDFLQQACSKHHNLLRIYRELQAYYEKITRGNGACENISNNGTIYFDDCGTLAELKYKHNCLIKLYHPDNVGIEGDEICKSINAEYDMVKERLKQEGNG